MLVQNEPSQAAIREENSDEELHPVISHENAVVDSPPCHHQSNKNHANATISNYCESGFESKGAGFLRVNNLKDLREFQQQSVDNYMNTLKRRAQFCPDFSDGELIDLFSQRKAYKQRAATLLGETGNFGRREDMMQKTAYIS